MTKQNNALRLAAWLHAAAQICPQLNEDEPGGYASEVDQVMDEAAFELRRLHAESETLRSSYAAARLEIESLKSQLAAEPPAPRGAPVAWLNPWRADQVTTDYDAYGERGIPLYTAPQQQGWCNGCSPENCPGCMLVPAKKQP